jgi:hypothetical protein
MGITSSNYSGGILTTKYDNSKIFIFDNEFTSGVVENDDAYDDLELEAGTIMGRITATGKLVPLASAASDGSQFPVGVLAANYTIDVLDEQTVQVCISGEVDETKLIFDGSDDLDTDVDGRILRDRIASDTAGIILKAVSEMSEFDND